MGRCLASAQDVNDPALHEFPAALQVGLGWPKAMGVNSEKKSGVESLRRLDVSVGFLLATPAAKLSPSVALCITLDPVSAAERGAVFCGQRTTSISSPRLAPWRGTPASLALIDESTTRKTAIMGY